MKKRVMQVVDFSARYGTMGCMKTILGIESSCDETAIAVLEVHEDGAYSCLSSAIASQADIHARFGGVVPEVAARHHAEAITPLLRGVLIDAYGSVQDARTCIDVVAVTQGPGLMIALSVGLDMARVVAREWGVPLIPVNHLMGHVYSGLMVHGGIAREYPLVSLVASGGHTEIVVINESGAPRVIGMTLDDAVGECFDKVAKMLGLGYPGGPAVSAHAVRGTDTAFEFPRALSRHGDLCFSYSGLKTAVLYAVRDIESRHPLTPPQIDDVCASFQSAALEPLVAKTCAAAKQVGARMITVGGGVSANSRLRALFAQARIDIPVYFSPLEYTGDNASMIAYVAGLTGESVDPASASLLSLEPSPRLNFEIDPSVLARVLKHYDRA